MAQPGRSQAMSDQVAAELLPPLLQRFVELIGLAATMQLVERFGGVRDYLRDVVAQDAALPVILVTGHADVATAVLAMREGAYEEAYQTARQYTAGARQIIERSLIEQREDDPLAPRKGKRNSRH